VAALRAVDVGGTIKLPMADLRPKCGRAGFAWVSTYIASGDVAVLTESEVRAALAAQPESYAGRPAGVLVRTAAGMAGVLGAEPVPFRLAEPHSRDLPARSVCAIARPRVWRLWCARYAWLLARRWLGYAWWSRRPRTHGAEHEHGRPPRPAGRQPLRRGGHGGEARASVHLDWCRPHPRHGLALGALADLRRQAPVEERKVLHHHLAHALEGDVERPRAMR
jgi:hypothetical protein